MIARIKFFLFVIVLQCPPSLLLPLAQQDIASINNQSLVQETNQTERLTPKSSKVNELIQQIDVKDNANKVISNINHVDISDDSIVSTSKRNENNGSNNLVANNATYNTEGTNALNVSNAENITVLERHNGTQSNVSSEMVASLNTLSSDESLPPVITTFTNSVEEISRAEVPVFRSLIPDKITKRHASKNVSTTVAPTTSKNHNLVLKLIPDSSPITIDLNQIPLNNLFGEAFGFLNRFKRNAPNADKTPKKTNCKSVPVDENHSIIVCNKTITKKDLNTTSLTPTRKSLQDIIFDVKKLYDTVELTCPLSVIVKLYTHQVLNKLAKDNLHDILNQILSSFMKGDEDVITVITKELSEIPFKLKLRLQLLHGETKEFLEKLSKTVDTTLCSIS